MLLLPDNKMDRLVFKGLNYVTDFVTIVVYSYFCVNEQINILWSSYCWQIYFKNWLQCFCIYGVINVKIFVCTLCLNPLCGFTQSAPCFFLHLYRYKCKNHWSQFLSNQYCLPVHDIQCTTYIKMCLYPKDMSNVFAL